MDEEKKEEKLRFRRTYRIVISLRPTPWSVACINLFYSSGPYVPGKPGALRRKSFIFDNTAAVILT
jgi:hypothetical protein